MALNMYEYQIVHNTNFEQDTNDANTPWIAGQ